MTAKLQSFSDIRKLIYQKFCVKLENIVTLQYIIIQVTIKSKKSSIMTKEQVLIKLTALCAKSEYCIFDIKSKMKRWQIDEKMQESIIEYLLKERYVDETRYVKAFIKSKATYNKWGKYKIEQALHYKHISKDLYAPYLDDINMDESDDILISLLKQKYKTVKGDSEYEKKGKLIRFAIQRGFPYDQVQKCIDTIIEENC